MQKRYDEARAKRSLARIARDVELDAQAKRDREQVQLECAMMAESVRDDVSRGDYRYVNGVAGFKFVTAIKDIWTTVADADERERRVRK